MACTDRKKLDIMGLKYGFVSAINNTLVSTYMARLKPKAERWFVNSITK